ncbi:MAG: hypothetical protein R3330_01610 [Saprospiraceae bacterium]|nr:hypothetical protein [Saprospiraceae bacterium]
MTNQVIRTVEITYRIEEKDRAESDRFKTTYDVSQRVITIRRDDGLLNLWLTENMTPEILLTRLVTQLNILRVQLEGERKPPPF